MARWVAGAMFSLPLIPFPHTPSQDSPGLRELNRKEALGLECSGLNLSAELCVTVDSDTVGCGT